MFTIFVLLNIRNSLDFWTIRTIVVAFVTSRLDYANSVLYCIPAKYISRQTLLQRTQNTLARVVAGTHNWNFGGMNRAFKPERQNKNQILIIWKPLSRSWQKNLQGYAPWMHHECDFVGGPISPNKYKMTNSGHPEFREMIISSQRMKISAPNLVGRCITAMRRWSHDQKSKPEVNSREVIEWTSEA